MTRNSKRNELNEYIEERVALALRLGPLVVSVLYDYTEMALSRARR